MSYTIQIKNEITAKKYPETEMLALVAGYIRNNCYINDNSICMTTENINTKNFIKTFIENTYDINTEIFVQEGNNFSKKKLYLIKITSRVDYILENLGYRENNIYLETPPSYLVDGNAEIRGYLRGVFLAVGSINNPKTSTYHMEFLINKPNEAIFVQKLLNIFEMNAKLLNRGKGYMVYLKEADKISDFLKILNVNNAVMFFEDVRVYRDKKNRTNRLNNCEQANVDKIVSSATKQLQYIEIIKENMGVNLLDEKTKVALEYREKYPESSLQELSEIISLETGKTITKSGLNHRFRKIRELASKFR